MNRLLGVGLIALVLGCLSFIGQDDFSKELAQIEQEQKGIHFDTLNLSEAKALAQVTGKLIFIDVKASWCGNCKLMEKGPFQNEKVGEMYNSSFINVKIDGETGGEDADFVARAYGVRAYPTFLFINSRGKLIKSSVGYRSDEELLFLARSVQ